MKEQIYKIKGKPHLEGVAELEGYVEAESVEAGRGGNAVRRKAGVQLSERGLQVGGVHRLLLVQPLQHS